MSERGRFIPWDKLPRERSLPPRQPGAGDPPAEGRSGVGWSDPIVIGTVMHLVELWWTTRPKGLGVRIDDKALVEYLVAWLTGHTARYNLRLERKRERTTDPPRDSSTAAPAAQERAPTGRDRPDGPGQGPGYGAGGYGQSFGFGGAAPSG